MEILRLTSVPGFIAFDLDDAPMSAGGTRMAPDVTEGEVALLARAMTYKFAVLGIEMGGAKAAICADPADPDRAEMLKRYCDEIHPLVATRRFLTGPDMGTHEEDFAFLRDVQPRNEAVLSTIDGVSFEDVLTGYGVVAAGRTALGSLEGRTFAVEGFGKVGGGVAREVARQGGRLVAVSTLRGCAVDPGGIDVARLWALRADHGDDCVLRLGPSADVPPREALFDVEADVLVPGARPGVITAERARGLRAKVIAPAANVPYTADSVAVLRERGILALPDYVCSAGGVLGYLAPRHSGAEEVLANVATRIEAIVGEITSHPEGPLAGAADIAERHLRTWRDDTGMPEGPPYA